MSDYLALRATAAALIAAKGRTMTLRSRSSGSYNASTGGAVVTTSNTTITGVVSNFPLLLVDGTQIQRGDVKVLTVSSVEPKPGDGLLIGSIEYDVVSVREINPGGTVVLYSLQARRGG